MKRNTILTRSGRTFDFNDPESHDYCIEDIAYALSNICRYNGHYPRFYSVAEHSVYVAICTYGGCRFEALMHDAHEAYCGDMVKPLKNMMPEYAALEDRIERAVRAHFCLPGETSVCVKKADHAARKHELAIRDRLIAGKSVKQPRFSGILPQFHQPKRAEKLFLEWFEYLRKVYPQPRMPLE